MVTGMGLPLLGSGILIWIGVKSWGTSTGSVRLTWGVAMAISLIGILISRYVGKSPFYRRQPVGAVE
jgi:hypothetical protein